MKHVLTIGATLLLTSCAALTGSNIQPPPEFNQKVGLIVDSDYEMYQATRSGYDVGDLQSFHTQHTLPIVVEERLEELFGEVEMYKNRAGIETQMPDVPAVFEVRMIDLAHDVTFEGADTYRAETTLAVAMKSPRGKIFWQKAFRGDGWVNIDPQFSTGLGPQDAVLDAVHDALDQMQRAILNSPEVRNQLRHYEEIEEARRAREVGL